MSTLELGTLTPDMGVRINGVNNYDYAGYWVGYAGDLNNDGMSDFLIGARSNGPYLLFGGTWLNGLGVLELSTLVPGNGLRISLSSDYTERSLSYAGDVNGDGISDFLVSAYKCSYQTHCQATYPGVVSLVFGGVWLNNLTTLDLDMLTPDIGVRINGVAFSTNTGYSLSYAGDVNNDGVSDFLIGGTERFFEWGEPDVANVFIVFGGAWLNNVGIIELDTLTSTQGVRISGVNSNDRTGRSVSYAGDVNNDGVSDFLIGAATADPGGRDAAGSAFLIFGGHWLNNLGTLALNTTLASDNGVCINGVSENDSVGYSVNHAGDVNNDGISDFLIGARWASPGNQVQAGSAYVVFGRDGSGASAPLTDIATKLSTVPLTVLSTEQHTESPTNTPTTAEHTLMVTTPDTPPKHTLPLVSSAARASSPLLGVVARYGQQLLSSFFKPVSERQIQAEQSRPAPTGQVGLGS